MIGLLILLVIVETFLFGYEPVATPFLYQFFHANVFHLLANGLALLTIFPMRRKDNWYVALTSYVISVIVFPLSHLTPIGISNMLYAAIGMRTPAFSSPWWKSSASITFHLVTLLMLAIPHFSAVSHIYAYIMGIGTAAFIRYINDVHEDEKRILR